MPQNPCCIFVSEDIKNLKNKAKTEIMTAVKNVQTENTGHLRIVIGGKKRSTDQLITKAWLFAHAALWEGKLFARDEIATFKKLIEEFFEEKDFDELTLIEFCERVILTKRYVARSPYRYVVEPLKWLNINFRYGIRGTERWYNDVEEQRVSLPECNNGINILAVAVLMYTNNPSPFVYNACRNKLIELKQFDLVSVFNSLVTTFHYLNN